MTIEEALDMLEYGDWFQSVYNNLPESTANKVAEAIEALAKVVHIDREKWEPCHSCDSKCLICMVNETHKCRICKDYKYYLPLYQFCPKCGRPLTDQAWAELEKRMRGMMA